MLLSHIGGGIISAECMKTIEFVDDFEFHEHTRTLHLLPKPSRTLFTS